MTSRRGKMAQRVLLPSKTTRWVRAPPIELAAAQRILDEKHKTLSQDTIDSNLYTCGRMGEHNIVIAGLPAGRIGANSAATIAAQMISKFTSIRISLMVGIKGGVPSATCDVRLGDVVISQPQLGHGGVIQYDLGKPQPNRFERTEVLKETSTVLLNALTKLQANHIIEESRFSIYLSILTNLPIFARVKAGPDILFEPSYGHIGEATCDICSTEHLVVRAPHDQEIMVHYGTIASGNQAIKNGINRDRLNSELGGVLCFEMEAAGLMENLSCHVIRGICDYMDSHKNKNRQPFAVATATAYAKELLSVIPPANITKMRAYKQTRT